jgi:hypothetical protein
MRTKGGKTMEIISGLLIAVLLPFSILAASYIVITTDIEEEEPQSIEEARNALWDEYTKGDEI